MVEKQLQLDPTIEEADQGGPSSPSSPLSSLKNLRFGTGGSRAPGHAAQQEIPKGHLRATTYRRDAIYRRALALADVASAAIAVLVGVPILGDDALSPLALLALPLVLVVAKVAGLYDRDEHLVRRTTLDEVPTLFWAATLYAFLIWLGGNLIVVGQFGRDQAIGVWALFFLSMVSIRALARYLAGIGGGRGAMPGARRRRDRQLDHPPLSRDIGPEGASGGACATGAGVPHEWQLPPQRQRQRGDGNGATATGPTATAPTATGPTATAPTATAPT